MTRKKVKLAFITNDSSRKATYKKRKKGLMKKVNELSTLCGIDACAIIYSPYESQPEVWPNKIGVQHVLSQFKKIPEIDRSKNMLNQESFIKKQISKANEQIKKQMKENREKEMTEVMYQCLTGKGSIDSLTLPDLNDLSGLVDQTLKDISKRIESLKVASPGEVAAPPPPPPPASGGGGGDSSTTMVVENVGGMQRGNQWLTDWINNPITQFLDNPNRIWPHGPHPFFPDC